MGKIKKELRLYQKEAVAAVWDYLRNHDDNPCVVLPTGTGKSLVIAELVSEAVKKWHGRVLILAHVKELLQQNAEKIRLLCPGVKVGMYSAGLKSRDTEDEVIVAGIQSAHRRACELGAFDLILVDEAHLIPPDGDGMYREFLRHAKVVNPVVRLVGFTATPFRLKGGLICKPENLLNAVCYEAGLKEMISQGFLSPIIPRGSRYDNDLDFSNLHIRAGEFLQDEIEILMNNNRLVTNACREIVDLTADRKATLIFGVSIDHCRKIKNAIEKFSGQECALVTGETPAEERAELLDRFKGKTAAQDLYGTPLKPLHYLVNVSVLTTGFDAPNCDCVAILRPTASPGLLLQMVGRGLRLSPDTGKVDCLVLDYGENIMRHGPLDAIRVDDKSAGAGRKGEPPAKKCPKCNMLVEASRSICPECGYVFPPRELKHDAWASQDGLLSGQVTTHEEAVQKVEYKKWEKRNNTDNKPPTLCIEYTLGLNNYFREWLCPEHTGYARAKFEKWWDEHKSVPFDPVPKTVDEAVKMANSGILNYPVKITIRHVAGDKFDRICHYEYGETPAEFFEEQQWKQQQEEEFNAMSNAMLEDENYIPF